MTQLPKTLLAIWMLLGTSCDAFLDEKPLRQLVVPNTLADLNALMENPNIMYGTPTLGILASDDLLTDAVGWASYPTELERNAYIWKREFLDGVPSVPDWNTLYQQVFYANVVLEGAERLREEADGRELDMLRGRALFHRSLAFFNLLETFSPPYADRGERPDSGIPLRLESDPNLPSVRSGLEEAYARVIEDLLWAASHLPASGGHPARPTAGAARALLARIYLAMEEYGEALAQAGLALQQQDALIDYATLDTALLNPFPVPADNPEIIFYTHSLSQSFIRSALTGVDTALLASYPPGDLRSRLLYTPNASGWTNLTGIYTGSSGRYFTGLTVPEMLLIVAECQARMGRDTEAREALSRLTEARYPVGQEPAAGGDLLSHVLAERRREMAFRGQRWSDLRRLNRDPLRARELVRVVGADTFRLSPSDPRYVFPLPQNEVEVFGLAQNPR